METLKDRLIEKGISPSFHRIKIYQYLLDNRVHPTVEHIFNDMQEEIPTLSKTTIYNTLRTLVQNGLVMPVTIEDNEVRYDADVSFHGHFKCTICNMIYDVEIDESLNSSFQSMDGHVISDTQIYMKGTCKHCRN